MRLQRFILLILIAGVIITDFQLGFAIPAFARKYKVSCTTCHSPFPKLKDFGDEFAGNGFVMEGQEPTRSTIDTGDELLLLQRELPLALRLDAYAQLRPDSENGDVQNDLQTPYILKILSGGRVTKNVSYYFYFFFSERGEVAGIEDAYLHFNNLFNQPFDVMVGQFQVSDPLFKRELRLTFEDYQVYRTKVGFVPSNLTYDRGLMITYTAPWGSDFVGEIVNGNGIDPADDHRQFDNDDFKNFVLRWTHGVGPFRLGAFGYYGETEHPDSLNNNIMMVVGPDASLNVGPLEMNFQYLLRTDDNPLYTGVKPKDEIETKGGLAEVIFAPNGDKSRWLLIGLYNKVTSNINDKLPGQSPIEYESVGLTGTYLLGRNLRIMAEYNRDLEFEKNRFTIGFVSAF
jgi:hypothetical protein